MTQSFTTAEIGADLAAAVTLARATIADAHTPTTRYLAATASLTAALEDLREQIKAEASAGHSISPDVDRAVACVSGALRTLSRCLTDGPTRPDAVIAAALAVDLDDIDELAGATS